MIIRRGSQSENILNTRKLFYAFASLNKQCLYSLKAISHGFRFWLFYHRSLVSQCAVQSVNLGIFRLIAEQNIDLHGISFNSVEMKNNKSKLNRRNSKHISLYMVSLCGNVILLFFLLQVKWKITENNFGIFTFYKGTSDWECVWYQVKARQTCIRMDH